MIVLCTSKTILSSMVSIRGARHLSHGVRSLPIPRLGAFLLGVGGDFLHAHVPRLAEGGSRPLFGHPQEVPQQGHPCRLRDDSLHCLDLRQLPLVHAHLPDVRWRDQPRGAAALSCLSSRSLLGAALRRAGKQELASPLIASVSLSPLRARAFWACASRVCP